MASRIGLRQLHAFHAVMVAGGVGAAADRLNLTQPAISKQLTALEHALGMKLFRRQSGRAATPTQDGIEFYKAIETTIAGLDELEAIARNIKAKARRQVCIAATPPLINSAPLMRALHRFRMANPDTNIALEPRHRLDIEDWVATRRIDLALALLPSKHPGLHAVPFVDTEVVIAMCPDHRLANKERIDAASLDGETIILPSRQPLRSRIEAEFERLGIHLDASFESSSAITCCRMAIAGLGIAICDPYSPSAFAGNVVTVRALAPTIRLTYGALLNNSRDQDDIIGELMEMLHCEFTSSPQLITSPAGT